MKQDKSYKQIEKGFKYEQNQSEYTLKIRKKCKWCWLLLLLLLPLLLLIPLKKDVTFKVLNSYDNSVVSDLNVNFDYTKRDLFNFENYGFFTRINPYPNAKYYSDTTNSNGIVIFKNIKYNVYQWLFRNNDITRVYSDTNECFGLDTSINFFDLKKENIVYITTFLKDIEFTVVDADDNNEALPNALVTIEADMFSFKDSMRSDAAGKVYFKQVPYCSNINVIGSKYGWYNNTISGKLKDHQGDTLFLKQEKVIVKFFVKDVNTKKPLVNAHGQLFFNDDPNTQIGTDAITNINGVGKGVFNDVHKIKKINIVVNKNRELRFYNDSSSREMLGQFIKVEDWNRRTDNQKIIYLRPEPNPILFQNIDCDTKQGLPNIENTVTITKPDGSIIGPTIIISDSHGEFSVSAALGDKITIEAISKNICPNEYLSNTTTIVDALYDNLKDDANKRKIPLCKKKATTQRFRNVDANNHNIGIEGVINNVTTKSGKSFTVTSGTDGWFEIDKVYECEIISITANGTSVGYGINDTKVSNDPYRNLISPNPQDLRDIPLRIIPPTPPKPPPCSTHQNSGGEGVTVNEYNMLDNNLTFYIDYNMNSQEDHMIVYCGRKSNLGNILVQTPGKVSYKGRLIVDLSKCSGSSWVTVKIIGGSSGTSWDYSITCP